VVVLQSLQTELQACQQKQLQQQAEHEAALSLLQADVATMRCRLENMHENTQAGLEQLQNSSKLQKETQQQQIQDAMEVRLLFSAGTQSSNFIVCIVVVAQLLRKAASKWRSGMGA
jgi:hypothetical protein